MPDITMCLNTECPLRKECYRYMAIPSAYKQSYADFKALIRHDGTCDYFVPIEKGMRIKKEEEKKEKC